MKHFKTLMILIFSIFNFFGCYSVFEGGTSGIVVDSESTTSPKRGIGNVDVYAYTSQCERDSDFNLWKEGEIFGCFNKRRFAHGQNRAVAKAAGKI